jgi:hypothetical protein
MLHVRVDPARHRHTAGPALTARLLKDRLVNPGAGDRSDARPCVGRHIEPVERPLRHQVQGRYAARRGKIRRIVGHVA